MHGNPCTRRVPSNRAMVFRVLPREFPCGGNVHTVLSLLFMVAVKNPVKLIAIVLTMAHLPGLLRYLSNDRKYQRAKIC